MLTVTNESIFRIPVPAKISRHVPEKNMAKAITRDMAFSDWLKLAALCLFRAQSVSKNKSICDCAGARPQSNRLTLLLLSQLLLFEVHFIVKLFCYSPNNFSLSLHDRNEMTCARIATI